MRTTAISSSPESRPLKRAGAHATQPRLPPSAEDAIRAFDECGGLHHPGCLSVINV